MEQRPTDNTPDFRTPDFRTMVRGFTRIGLLSFGGPAGQIALMHRELVDERRWIGEGPFLRALNFCHLLPGPEAQQLATYIGWRLHGWRGGLAAGGLFVLPGAVVMLGLSILYVLAAGLGWFAALFMGIKAAVLAIVVQALIRIGKRALDTRFKLGLAVAAFLALFVFDLPFPLVVLGSGAVGLGVASVRPDWLNLKHATAELPPATPRPWGATIRTILMWLAIWAAPMLLVIATLGPDHVLVEIGAFFAQLAVVTFGGAYAVLAYMAQEAVTTHGWLMAGEMADGLGLAETTPGPLIMVTQFVGFLGAYRAPAPFDPMVAGVIGAALTTWMTFAPCFLWIFAMAPWIDRLEHAHRLHGGLAAVTAAVVGVIANLTLWFALHVVFRSVSVVAWGPIRTQWPDWVSIDWRAGVLTALAMVLAFGLKWPVVRLLAAMAAAGWLIAMAG